MFKNTSNGIIHNNSTVTIISNINGLISITPRVIVAVGLYANVSSYDILNKN